MDSRDVLPALVKGSGQSMSSISTKMGRSRNFIVVTIQKNSTPYLDTVSEVADVCGYDLLLRRRDDGTEIIIDPPKRK